MRWNCIRNSVLFMGFLMLSCGQVLGQDAGSGTDEDKEVTKLFLIRHAEVGSGGTNPRDPELSEEGKQRAEDLVRLFEKEGIDVIYSTDLIRTKSTAQPLADKLGKSIELYHPNKLDVDKFLEENKGKRVLIVGHSNTTPFFVNYLIGQQNRYQMMSETNFSSVYVVHYLKKGMAWASELSY